MVKFMLARLNAIPEWLTLLCILEAPLRFAEEDHDVLRVCHFFIFPTQMMLTGRSFLLSSITLVSNAWFPFGIDTTCKILPLPITTL